MTDVAQAARAEAERRAAKEGGEPFTGNVAGWRDRQMNIWVPNTMMEQKMMEIGVRFRP